MGSNKGKSVFLGLAVVAVVGYFAAAWGDRWFYDWLGVRLGVRFGDWLGDWLGDRFGDRFRSGIARYGCCWFGRGRFGSGRDWRQIIDEFLDALFQLTFEQFGDGAAFRGGKLGGAGVQFFGEFDLDDAFIGHLGGALIEVRK